MAQGMLVLVLVKSRRTAPPGGEGQERSDDCMIGVLVLTGTVGIVPGTAVQVVKKWLPRLENWNSKDYCRLY